MSLYTYCNVGMDDMFSARHIHKLAGQFVNTRWHDLQSKPKQWLSRQKKIQTVLYSICRTVWTWKLLLLQFYAWTSFPSRFLSQTFCCKTYWRKELFEQGTCRGFCGRRPQRPWSPAWEHWGRPSSLATLILMFAEMFVILQQLPRSPTPLFWPIFSELGIVFGSMTSFGLGI